MNSKLELLKRVKNNTLERVIREFGSGPGGLSIMKLSIWDVRTILYEEIAFQAESILDREKEVSMEEFSR